MRSSKIIRNSTPPKTPPTIAPIGALCDLLGFAVLLEPDAVPVGSIFEQEM